MQVGYTVISVDGTEAPGQLALPEDPDPMVALRYKGGRHERMNAIVALVRKHIGEDNEPERVRVFHSDIYTDMFVDESGVNKRLPRNDKATAIYLNNVRVHDPDEYQAALDDGSYIAGTVVLFHKPVWT